MCLLLLLPNVSPTNHSNQPFVNRASIHDANRVPSSWTVSLHLSKFPPPKRLGHLPAYVSQSGSLSHPLQYNQSELNRAPFSLFLHSGDRRRVRTNLPAGDHPQFYLRQLRWCCLVDAAVSHAPLPEPYAATDTLLSAGWGVRQREDARTPATQPGGHGGAPGATASIYIVYFFVSRCAVRTAQRYLKSITAMAAMGSVQLRLEAVTEEWVESSMPCVHFGKSSGGGRAAFVNRSFPSQRWNADPSVALRFVWERRFEALMFVWVCICSCYGDAWSHSSTVSRLPPHAVVKTNSSLILLKGLVSCAAVKFAVVGMLVVASLSRGAVCTDWYGSKYCSTRKQTGE